jgi:hypothetical protein
MATEKYLSYIIQGDTEYIIQDPETSKKLDKPISVNPVAGSILGISPNAETITVTWVPYTDYLKDYALSSDLSALAARIDANYYTITDLDAKLGLKADLVDGKVPAEQLPSYVDDVIEGYYFENAFYSDSEHTTAIAGEISKIYVDLTNNVSPVTYRYSGSTYIKISSGMEKEDYYTSADLDVKLTGKADLVDGVVPNTQLPNYTAWEVYPTDRDLEPGEYSKTFIIEGNEETFINSTKISAGMTEQFAIYTNSPVAESDIIIDWGDGNTSSIKNGDYFSVATEDNQEYRIEVAHTYEVPNQIYTVKVYGKKYWKVAHIASTNNIMCRCIADDLPVASHLMTMANFATRANRLLYVNIPAYHKVLTIPNWANAFMGCVNLVKATGFKRFYSLYTVGNLFNTCLNLVDTDIRIPQTVTDISYIFHDCKQLSKDITKLFANQNNVILGFTNDAINVQNAFYGCQKLSGTIPAQIFWNEHSINFIGKETCFKDCSLSSTAPVSWGGTDSAASIDAKLIDRVIYLEQRVKYLEQLITDDGG